MRSSQNIAAATSTASVNLTRDKTFKIENTILPGSSSTVPGTRPRAMLYNHTKYADHNKLAGFVSQNLSTLPSGIKIAVLCGRDISAREINDLLSSKSAVMMEECRALVVPIFPSTERLGLVTGKRLSCASG